MPRFLFLDALDQTIFSRKIGIKKGEAPITTPGYGPGNGGRRKFFLGAKVQLFWNTQNSV